MVVMKAENLLELKIKSAISTIEKHLDRTVKLEKAGNSKETGEQLKHAYKQFTLTCFRSFE